MNIVITTTPIRPVPTDYPPFGSLAVIQSLRKAGYDPYFYDIDGLRPEFEDVEAFFAERRPDVLGISAVVSTAYGYTKKLIRAVKRVSPKTKIVLGGNLAASAEIMHRLAGVDYCVVGEGEVVSVNLMRCIESRLGMPDDEAALSAVKGITFVDKAGEMRFTGFELALPADEVFRPDYSILEKYSKIENFISDPMQRDDLRRDPRSHEPHRRGKKMGTLITAKGCVARCTFCHRWDKGFRAVPVQQIVEQIRFLKERYNVGFIQFSDENFGSDRRQLKEFCAAMKQEDVLYNVGGVRVRSVTPEILRELKDSGCVGLYYGIETGSPDILEVMEKKATLEHNRDAVRWTQEAGLYTIYQMILGMPGETEKTVRETIEFLKEATAILDESPINRMSINYIQALPGTPVFEYARLKGFIGKSLADEEAYLLKISDINAQDETKFINFTQYDYMTVQSWRRRITLETTYHYRKVHGLPRPPLRDLLNDVVFRKFIPSLYRENGGQPQSADYTKGGYFNLQRNLNYHIISAYCYWAGPLIIWLWLLRQEFRRLPTRVFLGHLWEHFAAKLRKAPPPINYQSLRKTMEQCAPKPLTPTEHAMVPLRAGR